MRRTIAMGVCCILAVAACGGNSDDSDTTPSAVTVSEPEPEPEPAATEPEPAATEPEPEPAATEPDPEPAATEPEPAATEPPEATTTTEPPRPVRAVGLVPLPGAVLDFSAVPVANPSLVWSLYSGSGGVIVENIGGPIAPGCHGISFFDPDTFEMLQIDATDLEAYATRGDGSCDSMEQMLPEGVVDGEAVKINTDDLIMFDFGALPPPPFDVSTQVVDPGGGTGVFRSADPEAPLFDNRLDDVDITHVVGADVVLEADPTTGDFVPIQLPLPEPGDCSSFDFCLYDRFGVGVTAADGTPGQVLVSSEEAGLFTFVDGDEWKALAHIVNGCQFNERFWVFAAGTASVGFDLTVTDTTTGERRSYSNLLDNFLEPILDTDAFATCP